MSSAQEKYTEIKTAMLLYMPFFASLLLDMMTVKVGKFPHLFGSNEPTAATDGKTIYIDEDFLSKIKLPQAVFLICHEIGHAMWNHMPRAKHYESIGLGGKEFDARKWNYAGDYIINDMLVKAKAGEFIEGGLLDPKYDHETMLTEEVYRDLPDDPSGGGGGQGTIDTHLPASSATANASPAEWKRAVQSAADAAKAQGKLPASLERFVDAFVNPKVDWRELLRTAVMKSIGRDTHTWAKPHRRRLFTQGVVLPGYTGFGAGTVVVAVDTSGSIGRRELNAFLSETQAILDVAKPECVYLVPCDAEVHEVTVISEGDSLLDNPPPLGGGGGTAFGPVFEWIDEQGITPDAVVYLTDMYGSFPDDPGYTTIWCSTSQIDKAPFGQVIQIEVSDEE